MSTNNFFKSNLNNIHNIVQSSMLVYPKERIISILRSYFSECDYYTYSMNQWGFANTTDHTGLPLGSDMLPNAYGSTSDTSSYLPTRLFIGENYRYDSIFYPAILVKSGGGRYVPISLNREQGTIKYQDIIYEDGYGNNVLVKKPCSFITAGAWEGSIVIDIVARSLRARDDLIELTAMCFTDIHFDTLFDAGLIVKPLQYSSTTETEDRNDKLFKQNITLDIRTEWRREVPISNIVDNILFSVQFENLSNENAVPAANLTINSEISLFDEL